MLNVVAKNIAFDKLELEAPADAPFVIDFKNEDVGSVTHDIDIHGRDGTTVVQDQAPIPGGQASQYATRRSRPGPTRSSARSTPPSRR